MQLVLISGLSGSGKSIALAMLEDCGFYCVDNLPVGLLSDLIAVLQGTGCQQLAVAIDMRSGDSVRELPQQIEALKGRGIDLRAVFLDADTETLLKRFSETRRRHPLSVAGLTLPEAIRREREALSGIGAVAQRIDTSGLAPGTLRAWIRDLIGSDRSRMTLLFESFAFKHGLPLDADLVFDARCLPNPHYDPALRPLTGRDAPVAAFLEADASARRLLDEIRGFVERWLPCFAADSRSYLTVAVGCTGGRHRSVWLIERLAAHFAGPAPVLVRHRVLEDANSER